MSAAFSNGFEYESWRDNWCDRCINDVNYDCPIVAVAVIDDAVPGQWSPGTDDLRDRYHCSEFKGRDERTGV